MKKRVFSLLLCVLMLVSAMLVGCNDEHEHTYATAWSSDATNHWHAATCEHKDEKKDLAAHTFGTDGKCTVCAYQGKIPSPVPSPAA